MKTFEAIRSIRKGWGGVKPVERIHTPKNEKGRSRSNWRRELEEEVAEALDGDGTDGKDNTPEKGDPK